MSLGDEFSSSKKPPRGALVEATQMGDEETVKSLLKKGANVNEINPRSPDDGTPLICAASASNTEIARLLIDRGADLEKKNGIGDTALIVAIRGGYTEVVRLLVDKGANVDARNNDGDTALMEASRCNCIQEAQLLVSKGADISIKNNAGRDALDMAVENASLQETEESEILNLLHEVTKSRQIAAAEKARAEAEALAERLHAVAVDRQKQLRERARQKPNFGRK